MGNLRRAWGRPLSRAALLFVASWWVGCGSETRETASAPAPAEVKGEPIRGEPITAPAAAPSSAPVVPDATSPTLAQTSPVGPASAAPAADDAPAAGGPPAGSAQGVAASTVPGAPASPAHGSSAGTPDAPLTVGFDRLSSFKYDLPEGPVDTNALAQATGKSQIPDSIRALNNQFVALKGYMLPLKVEKGLVTEMLILRDQSMCCYGAVPRINEWVSVKMVNAGAKPVMDQAVTLFGRLKVGEMYENGYLVGIYAVDGDRIASPLDM